MRILAALLLAAALLPRPASADDPPPRPGGTLDVVDRDGRPVGTCPLRHTAIEARVSGPVMRVVVTQEFANDADHPVEAVYTFPLSERAAVDAMELRAGMRRIRGEILRRDEARQRYEQAKAAGRLAARLDEERPDVFTQRVANLVPGAAVSVRIEYVDTLRWTDGGWEMVFPTVVGPRFVPGTPTGASGTGWSPDTDRVPDASRITPPVAPPGTRAGHDLSLAVDVEAGVPLGEITAPLHAIAVHRASPTRARVRLARRDEIPNRDVVLRVAVAGDAVRSAVLTDRRDDGDGTATLLLVPPRALPDAEAAPRELVFVVDRSGSQEGRPLEQAKAAIVWMIDHLRPQDTFQVVDFGSTAHVLFERPQPVTPATRARARAHVAALEADGGTMMAEAVARVCATPAEGNRLRLVVFMTDGYVGNDLEVIDLVKRLRGTSRWFPFGTGNAVNRFLLDGMAREGGGEAQVILLDDPADAVAERFHRRIAAPALTDVRVDVEGLELVDLLPAAPSDVWAAQPLVLHARYRSPGRGRVILRGLRAGRPWEETLDVELPARADRPELASLWARAKVDALLAQDYAALQQERFPAPLREAVERIALAHRLLTPFTSFVAVEDRVVDAGGRQETVVVPVEMPDGVSYEGVFGGGPALAQAKTAMPRAAAPAGMPAMQEAVRTRPAPPAAAAAPDARDDAAPPLPPAVRARLGASLLALLDGAPGAAVPHDGWLRVRIALATADGAALQALAAAGFQLDALAGTTATGLVRPAALATVAALPPVRHVDAA